MLKINVKNVNVTQSPIPQHFTTAIIYKKTAEKQPTAKPSSPLRSILQLSLNTWEKYGIFAPLFLQTIANGTFWTH